jgi:L-rhamnose mutarotase
MIDDATGKILAGQFWPSESTLGCLSVLKKLIETHGIPNFIYTDRAGVYGGTKRQEFSHFESACLELNIKIIYANSPQAKGRIERSNRTLQDRLIAEIRLAGIKNMSVYVENRLVNLYVAPRNLQNDANYMKKIKRGNDDLQITGIPIPLMKTG